MQVLKVVADAIVVALLTALVTELRQDREMEHAGRSLAVLLIDSFER